MSVYFYDKAIVEKTRKIINDSDVHIINNEKMFTKSRVAGDDVVMPAVSIYRDGYQLSDLNSGMPMYRQGRTIYDSGQEKLFTVRAIPIIIKYQFDVWTRTREQNDEFVRDLIWFYKLYPEHTIHLSHKATDSSPEVTFDVKFNVFLEENIVDNSDINEFENKGQYYRSTFNLTVDEAQLFMINEMAPYNSFNITVKSYDMEGAELDNETIQYNPEIP